MSHLVFARKYRPQTFKEIVGQEHVTRALTNAIVRDRVAHALIFTGPRGVGKTTSARVLSKALNCTGRALPRLGDDINDGLTTEQLIEKVEPCGSCSNCKEITKGSNLAVVEIDGASNNSVDNVRSLIETLLTAPPPNIKYKIYIIDEVHMLSVAAFNALLKTLEEPPPNTIFIFATTEPHKIPDTVISRCQQHDFRRFSLKDVKRQLRFIVESENISIEDEVLALIAKKCFGGMRDASSLLERVVSFCDGKVTLAETSKILGVFDFGHFASLIGSILDGQKEKSFEKIEQVFQMTLDIKSYFSDFVSAFRLAALFSLAKSSGKEHLRKFIATEEISESDIELLDAIVEKGKSELFFQMYDLAREISDIALKSQFPRYVLEAGIIKLHNIQDIISLSALVQNLSIGSSPRQPSQQSTTLKKKFSAPVTEVRSEKKISEVLPEKLKEIKPEVEVIKEDLEEELSAVPKEFLWSEFLAFLKNSGNVGIETYLKKVAPKEIKMDVVSGTGIFKVVAPAFVYEVLTEKGVYDDLKRHLATYSMVHSWDVEIEIHVEADLNVKTPIKDDKPKISRRVIPKTKHVPGSVDEKSQSLTDQKIRQIEEAAREDELVKQTLAVFAGSVIEKITPTIKVNK